MSLSGHLWTLAGRLRRGDSAPEAEPWSLDIPDPRFERVRLTGRLREEPDSSGLVVVVHGIGGCAEAGYSQAAAAAAERAGLSCLRINLRGCDRLGEDYYHAGLSTDLHRVLASPELSRFESLFLLGYSLGGHVALRYASGVDVEALHSRLKAVAAICSPLDLERSNQVIDSPRLAPYRRYVLSNLAEIYTAVAQRREGPIGVEEVAKIRTLREWDGRVVAPRWGFADAADYYRQASVAPHLPAIEVPALLVASKHDPMVPAATLRPVLNDREHRLQVHWIDGGGHVAFPASLEIGVNAPPGLEAQVMGWLLNQTEAGPAGFSPRMVREGVNAEAL